MRAWLMKVVEIIKQAQQIIKKREKQNNPFVSALYDKYLQEQQTNIKKFAGFQIGAKTKTQIGLVLAQQIIKTTELNKYRPKLKEYYTKKTKVDPTHGEVSPYIKTAKLFCNNIDIINKVLVQKKDNAQFQSDCDFVYGCAKKCIILDEHQEHEPIVKIYELQNEAKQKMEHFYEQYSKLVGINQEQQQEHAPKYIA